MTKRILELARAKLHDEEIVSILTEEGHRSPNCVDKVLPITPATVAPGASASSMIRVIVSAGHFRRRSASCTISSRFVSITVLTHVNKDAKPHDPRRLPKAAYKPKNGKWRKGLPARERR